jgi:DNA/RNA-binding domain of Phe-tRNA-synthetase-like protein
MRWLELGHRDMREGADMRIVVDELFWSLLPDAQIGTAIVRGIDNTRAADEAAALVLASAREAANRIGDGEIGAHPAVAPWREAYRRMGVKPSKYKSSIESLLRSARASGVRPINPLVDLYNAVSLQHLLPCGGEDLRTVSGDIRVTRATGDEAFVPLGSAEQQPPQPGEVIYRDDIGVLCRCLNWREAERTKLTETTTEAILCIEALPPVTAEALRAACDGLAALVQEHLGGTSTVVLLSRQRPEGAVNG